MPYLTYHLWPSYVSLDDEDHLACVVMHHETAVQKVRCQWPCSGQDPLAATDICVRVKELLIGHRLPLENQEMRNLRGPHMSGESDADGCGRQ